jgi:hypothetical protein
MSLPSVPESVVKAVVANAERWHFQEAYEGFNDCPAAMNDVPGFRQWPPGICDCGKAEAEVALAELRALGYAKESEVVQGSVEAKALA